MTNHLNRSRHTYIHGDSVRLRWASRWSAPAIQHFDGAICSWRDGPGPYATHPLLGGDEHMYAAWQRHYYAYHAAQD